MVNVVLELPLVDDVVDLLTDSLNPTVHANLTDYVFVESTLAKLQTLVDGLTGIADDILKLQWAQLSPLLLDGFKSGSRLVIVIASNVVRQWLMHVRWLVSSRLFGVLLIHHV